MNCRSCDAQLNQVVIDLGFSPPSNAYLDLKQLSQPEKHYPLRVMVCETCWLVQTEDFIGRDDVFNSTYHYFSSTSHNWVQHSKDYCQNIQKELNLGPSSFVVEVASNDGYLLQHFVELGIPCIGIEPTESTAKVAQQRGIETLVEFFGTKLAANLAQSRGYADLIIGNNVFAHVPDINDFTSAISGLMGVNSVCTLEFPHLLSLLKNNQFDTIYHEHFSYLSLVAIRPLLKRHGLRVFHIERFATHGGSLRVYICKIESAHATRTSVQEVLDEELNFGLNTVDVFQELKVVAQQMKFDLLKFLIAERELGRKVVAYGAAAKGNTFLNYAGIASDLIEFVVDAAEFKQLKFLPGSHIPILHPRHLIESKADSVLILPWNISDEVVNLYAPLLSAETNFYVAVPTLRKLEV